MDLARSADFPADLKVRLYEPHNRAYVEADLQVRLLGS